MSLLIAICEDAKSKLISLFVGKSQTRGQKLKRLIHLGISKGVPVLWGHAPLAQHNAPLL